MTHLCVYFPGHVYNTDTKQVKVSPVAMQLFQSAREPSSPLPSIRMHIPAVSFEKEDVSAL